MWNAYNVLEDTVSVPRLKAKHRMVVLGVLLTQAQGIIIQIFLQIFGGGALKDPACVKAFLLALAVNIEMLVLSLFYLRNYSAIDLMAWSKLSGVPGGVVVPRLHGVSGAVRNDVEEMKDANLLTAPLVQGDREGRSNSRASMSSATKPPRPAAAKSIQTPTNPAVAIVPHYTRLSTNEDTEVASDAKVSGERGPSSVRSPSVPQRESSSAGGGIAPAEKESEVQFQTSPVRSNADGLLPVL
uniref:Uncharacterized protein n=1 Tax=Lotharella globosa TaxID=91324 RepID=A0A7S4DTD9_9EUKA